MQGRSLEQLMLGAAGSATGTARQDTPAASLRRS